MRTEFQNHAPDGFALNLSSTRVALDAEIDSSESSPEREAIART